MWHMVVGKAEVLSSLPWSEHAGPYASGYREDHEAFRSWKLIFRYIKLFTMSCFRERCMLAGRLILNLADIL